jgi:hypothetical protein
MRIENEWQFFGTYVLVALAVMLPLLLPGFILTLDMVFTPNMPMPEQVSSSYLFYAALHALNTFLPADALQKIMLLAILILSGVGLHRLVRTAVPMTRETGEWGIAVASIFYMINPFTYSRFMAGQFAVLLGYALLPWLVRSLVLFGRQASVRGALAVAGWLALIGIVSIHTLGDAAVLIVAGLIVAVWRKRSQLGQYLKYGALALAGFIVASCYWLIPLLSGKGRTAELAATFGSADTQAYATVGGNVITQIFNVLRLQGFWMESKGLYALPQDRAILWGLMAIGVIALVVMGARILWQRARAFAAALLLSGLAGLILAVGLGDWARDVPLLNGFREPHKFVALVALAYAVCLAPGIAAFLARARKKSDGWYAVAAILVILLPFLFMRVMFWGFDKQLTPRQYPASWTDANWQLQQDREDFNVLFLPWHHYMSYGFAGRIIAHPAPKFFEKPVVVSNDPELGAIDAGKHDPRQAAITQALAGPPDKLANELAKHDIKYILLAKDLDFRKYDYLRKQPDFKITRDTKDLTIFTNQAWRNE